MSLFSTLFLKAIVFGAVGLASAAALFLLFALFKDSKEKSLW